MSAPAWAYGKNRVTAQLSVEELLTIVELHESGKLVPAIKEHMAERFGKKLKKQTIESVIRDEGLPQFKPGKKRNCPECGMYIASDVCIRCTVVGLKRKAP